MRSSIWNRIEQHQREIVERFTSSFPVKVGQLASELGLEVVRAPLQPKISGLIQPSETAPSGFQIKVNKFDSLERQRFTVAHEISHFLLHADVIGSGVVDSIMYRSNLTSRRETEANQLAAEIIMPSQLVVKQARLIADQDAKDVVESLASAFKVSPSAMEIRLGLT